MAITVGGSTGFGPTYYEPETVLTATITVRDTMTIDQVAAAASSRGSDVDDYPYYWDVIQNYDYSLTSKAAATPTTGTDSSTGVTTDTIIDIASDVSIVSTGNVYPDNVYIFVWDNAVIPDGAIISNGTYRNTNGDVLPFARAFFDPGTGSTLMRVIYNPYTDQIELRLNDWDTTAGNHHIDVIFGGSIYNTTGETLVIDGPFDNPLGAIKIRDSYDYVAADQDSTRLQTPWVNYDLYPFVAFTDSHIDGLLAANGTSGMVPYLNINGFIDTSKSFGFSSAAEKIQYSEGGIYTLPAAPFNGSTPVLGYPSNEIYDHALTPPVPVLVDIADPVYLPELFPRPATSPTPQYLYLHAMALDAGGNAGYSSRIHAEVLRVLPAIRGDYTPNTQLLTNNYHLSYSTAANAITTSHYPPVYTVALSTSAIEGTNFVRVDHYNIALDGEPLTDYTYPSTVFYPNRTRGLLAFNRTLYRYEFFRTSNISSEPGGFMSVAWPSGYYAGHLTLLIDGTLITSAWNYSTTDGFKFWSKASYDDGATWEAPVLITTVSGFPYPPTFPPVQDFRTGVIYAGYGKASGDMGRTWGTGF